MMNMATRRFCSIYAVSWRECTILLTFIYFSNPKSKEGERKQRLVREALYMLFRVESLVSINRDLINKISNHIDDINRGLFFLVSGIFLSFCKQI